MPPTKTKRSSFAKQAATASLAAPIVLVIAGRFMPVLLANHRDSSGAVLTLVYAGLSCLLLGGGFILGILALALMKRDERAQVASRVGIAVVVYGVLLAIAVPNFVRARELSRTRKQAMDNVSDAAASVREQAINAITKGGDRHVDLNQLEQSFDQAASKSTGDSAALMKGGRAYVQKLKAQQTAYEDAIEKLKAAKVLAITNLTDRSQIPARRGVVQQFLEANDHVQSFVSQNEQHFHKELDDAHASQPSITAALASFHKTSVKTDPIILKIRSDDDTMGHAMLDTLDLLDRSWGHWHQKSGGSNIVFERPADLEAYNTCMERLQNAADDQADAQQQLASMMSQQSQQKASR